MTKEQQMEEFSKAYIHAVTSVACFKVSFYNSPDDDSVDAHISSSGAHGTTHRPQLDVQLKSTSQDMMKEDGIHFPLSIKNYDDLRIESVSVPRLIIVILIPENIDDWLHHSEEKLIMYRCGYWMSLKNFTQVKNKQSVTIIVPKKQTFNPLSLKDIMVRINSNQAL